MAPVCVAGRRASFEGVTGRDGVTVFTSPTGTIELCFVSASIKEWTNAEHRLFNVSFPTASHLPKPSYCHASSGITEIVYSSEEAHSRHCNRACVQQRGPEFRQVMSRGKGLGTLGQRNVNVTSPVLNRFISTKTRLKLKDPPRDPFVRAVKYVALCLLAIGCFKIFPYVGTVSLPLAKE